MVAPLATGALRRAARATALLLCASLPLPAAAHLQFFNGRLLDLAQQSDRLVIATVDAAAPGAGDGRALWNVDIHVEPGERRGSVLSTAARMPIRVGGTYAFFVKQRDERLDCVHPAGVVFPAEEHAAAYHALDRGLRPLLHGPPQRLADVLLATLDTPVRELRYQVALALHDVAHGEHPLTAEQQARLAALLADAGFDAAIRPLLAPLIVDVSSPVAR